MGFGVWGLVYVGGVECVVGEVESDWKMWEMEDDVVG